MNGNASNFLGLQAIALWLSCIVMAVAALAAINVITVGRPHITRGLLAAVLAYVVAAPSFATFRTFIPTLTSISTHVATFAISVALLWLILFRPELRLMRQDSNRFLW